MRRITVLTALAAVVLFTLAAQLMSIEQPRYEVLEQEDALELRLYTPYLVAETVVGGELGRSSDRAFRRLAGYIFGDNRSRGDADDTGERGETGSRSEKIAMTSPVNMEPVEDGWRMTFMMPSEYTLEALPEPIDPAVRLRREEGGLHAAVRFSGRLQEGTFEERTETVRSWIEERGWVATGDPVLARYDPPWTPPPMRRNEVLIPVRTADRPAGGADPEAQGAGGGR